MSGGVARRIGHHDIGVMRRRRRGKHQRKKHRNHHLAAHGTLHSIIQGTGDVQIAAAAGR
jgi:hypothetical protein